MGRPVKRDKNGTLVFGAFATTAAGIKCQAYFGGALSAAAYIIKQVGSRRYLVTANGTDKAKCKLVSTTPSANGEMMLFGYTGPEDASMVVLKKLNKRTATDFSGNRYTWVLVNDSSSDYIQLTLVNPAD